MENIFNRVSALVEYERRKQDEKWGEQNHDSFKWLAILQEEVGEAAKARLENSEYQFFKEMIQVAAVAHAILECLIRKAHREVGNDKDA